MHERENLSAGASVSSSYGGDTGENGPLKSEFSGDHKRHKKHRSKSSSRTDEIRPSKHDPRKMLGAASNSLSAIPNRIAVSMLSSGLLKITDEEKSVKWMATKPFPSQEMSRVVAEHRKYPVLYKVEYEMAIRLDNYPSCRHASKESNDAKNQNKLVIPYDFNRVVLEPLPGVPDSDYINASYVDSLTTPNAYIVTQGPREGTVEDFWRMVWQEKTKLIVMLTKTFDFIKVMCVQYWPSIVGYTDTYGGLKIQLLKEEQLANFYIRTFSLIRVATGESREIVQFHYTEWPSHSNAFSISLLEFRRRIRIWMKNHLTPGDGPTVVHCSDGAGRSGVYVAVDANLELNEDNNLFDIYGCLKKMRQARKDLVENVDQYRFIYDTLEEFTVSGYTFFPVSELSQNLKQKSTKVDAAKNEYQLEFEKICKMTTRFTIGDCAGGHRADNRFKNRNVICVPPDNYRPYLTSFQGNSCTDYINSVFVDGYSRPREYIVTEWPVRSTVPDFWSLIYDHDVTSVLVLCNPTSLDTGYPLFWPEKEKSMKFGTVFTVDRLTHEHFQNIRTWMFKISKKNFPASEKSVTVIWEHSDEKTAHTHSHPSWVQRAVVWKVELYDSWRRRTFYFPMVGPHRKVLAKTEQNGSEKIVSLTELMAGIKAEPKNCQFFQFMCWPIGHKVPTSTNALVELMNVVEEWRSKTGHGPAIVVSPDGMNRAGVYCAANACIEQVVQHGEVDVFQAVKTARLHRPQLVNNIHEYKYCYDVVLHYVLHFLQKELHK